MTPRIEFGISKAVNEFCHFSVLYSDLMPRELAEGILGNRAYQENNRILVQDAVQFELQRIKPFPTESDWYEFTTGLMKRTQTGDLPSIPNNSSFARFYRDLRERMALGFDKIWEESRPRLEAYQSTFESLWSPISDRVLSRLAELAKTPWTMEKIHVHFIDCLYGGFAWNNFIGFTAFPDVEVEKKFLTHELSELITPQRAVAGALRKAGLNPGITHTVVDMLAYFSVREFLAKPFSPNPEKKGIRPNPNYYPEAEDLFPVFEHYAENPSSYSDFKSLIEEMITGFESPHVR